MGDNKKGTRGYSMPRAERGNKGVEVMLPPDALEKIDRMARAWTCPRSVAIVRLIREAEEPAEK